MRRPTRCCLFENDRPCWNDLEPSAQQALRQLMRQLLLEAARRAAVARSESEGSDDQRQAHA